jgi:hypothetical protein
MKRFDFLERGFVVSFYEEIGSQFAEVLDEIIGERIVVIDDQKHKEGVVRS